MEEEDPEGAEEGGEGLPPSGKSPKSKTYRTADELMDARDQKEAEDVLGDDNEVDGTRTLSASALAKKPNSTISAEDPEDDETFPPTKVGKKKGFFGFGTASPESEESETLPAGAKKTMMRAEDDVEDGEAVEDTPVAKLPKKSKFGTVDETEEGVEGEEVESPLSAPKKKGKIAVADPEEDVDDTLPKPLEKKSAFGPEEDDEDTLPRPSKKKSTLGAAAFGEGVEGEVDEEEGLPVARKGAGLAGKKATSPVGQAGDLEEGEEGEEAGVRIKSSNGVTQEDEEDAGVPGAIVPKKSTKATKGFGSFQEDYQDDDTPTAKLKSKATFSADEAVSTPKCVLLLQVRIVIIRVESALKLYCKCTKVVLQVHQTCTAAGGLPELYCCYEC